MCSFCDIQNAAPINIFSDDEIERIVVGVYSGLITPQSLDLVTYQKVAEKLTNGVYNGFGKSLTDVVWNSPDYTMLNSLRNNVYVFSGAKQYHQVREMVDAIYDKDRIKPFSEYKKTGTDIFKNYNENYLRAEYNAAISQSRSASMWMDIESNKELLPMLEYVTVGDGRVRPEHAMLDKIKRPVDDKFWNNYFPPNGWNCRCTTLQSDDTDKTSLKGFTQPKTVPPEFMMNAGKDKIVFSDKHPYFKVAKQDENLAANNFNMPKPRMEMPKMPEPVKVNEFVPDLIKQKGIKLDDDVYKLLGKKLDVQTIANNPYCDQYGKFIKIDFNSERWNKSESYQKIILHHEMGHAIHADKNIIIAGKSVSDEYKKHFSELKKLIKGSESIIEEKINNINRAIYKSTDAEKAEVFKKYGITSLRDANELSGAAQDALMALTNSRHGFGHNKSYMSKLGCKEAEMFAHSMENHFLGNAIFKEAMPEVYNESIKYIKSLIK